MFSTANSGQAMRGSGPKPKQFYLAGAKYGTAIEAAYFFGGMMSTARMETLMIWRGSILVWLLRSLQKA